MIIQALIEGLHIGDHTSSECLANEALPAFIEVGRKSSGLKPLPLRFISHHA